MFFLILLLVVYSHEAHTLEMNDILKEFSWPLRLKILNDISPAQNKTPHEKPSNPLKPLPAVPPPSTIELTESTPGLSEPTIPESEASPLNPVSLANVTTVHQSNSNTEKIPKPVKAASDIETRSVQPLERRVGVQLLGAPELRANDENDDKDMRYKLFRLMYEMVRDSDLKVKRAELIKEHYENMTNFEIGYAIGDITDKANVVTDMSVTLKRFYKEWKPMEYIIAYEQISNQAIEITRMIDLVRVLSRKVSEKPTSGLK